MQQSNPRLLALACHDLHGTPAFYDVGIEMEVSSLTREDILDNLRVGAYRIRSRFFNADAQFRISWAKSALLRVGSVQLAYLRQARSLALRWSA
jgi:hypothetical protein